jgi:hypothetical protein
MMVAQKIVVRVTSFNQVRVVGASAVMVGRAFSVLRARWSQKRVPLTLSPNAEHPEWLEVSFQTQFMKEEDAAARAQQIRAELTKLFE